MGNKTSLQKCSQFVCSKESQKQKFPGLQEQLFQDLRKLIMNIKVQRKYFKPKSKQLVFHKVRLLDNSLDVFEVRKDAQANTLIQTILMRRLFPPALSPLFCLFLFDKEKFIPLPYNAHLSEYEKQQLYLFRVYFLPHELQRKLYQQLNDLTCLEFALGSQMLLSKQHIDKNLQFRLIMYFKLLRYHEQSQISSLVQIYMKKQGLQFKQQNFAESLIQFEKYMREMRKKGLQKVILSELLRDYQLAVGDFLLLENRYKKMGEQQFQYKLPFKSQINCDYRQEMIFFLQKYFQIKTKVK